MRRGRAFVGLVLVCSAGAALGGAVGLRGPLLWGAGGLTLLTGIGLVLSSLRAPRQSADLPPATHAPQQWVDWQQTAVPRIGTILMDKYGLITLGELERALEIQKGSPRRLGEILVAMGLINQRQLDTALDYQRSLQRRSWSPSTGAQVPPGRPLTPRARDPLR